MNWTLDGYNTTDSVRVELTYGILHDIYIPYIILAIYHDIKYHDYIVVFRILFPTLAGSL